MSAAARDDCPIGRCNGRQARPHLVVADASASVRQAMRAALEERGFCVDVEAGTVSALVRRAKIRPHCFLVDHELPGGALMAVRRLRGISSGGQQSRVLVIGPRSDDDIALAAVRAGASGVVPRAAGTDAMVAAIRVVIDGGVSLDPQLAAAVVRDYQSSGRLTPTGGGESFPFRLSTRERRVLELLAEGLTTAQVADALFVTAATVRSHVASIVRRVGVRDRNAAVQRFASWSQQVTMPVPREPEPEVAAIVVAAQRRPPQS
jgi:DNA-binding NarL/FixJ family response regulator